MYKEVFSMADAVLILVIVGAFVCGFYLVNRLGKMLDEKFGRRKK